MNTDEYNKGYRDAAETAYNECSIEFDMYLRDIPEEYRLRAKTAILNNLHVKLGFWKEEK